MYSYIGICNQCDVNVQCSCNCVESLNCKLPQTNKQQLGSTRTIVAKASDGQRYLMPLSKCWFEFEGERGSGPEGVADVRIDGIVCPINCTALFL